MAVIITNGASIAIVSDAYGLTAAQAVQLSNAQGLTPAQVTLLSEARDAAIVSRKLLGNNLVKSGSTVTIVDDDSSVYRQYTSTTAQRTRI